MRLIDADALIEFCEERWIPLNIDAVNMQPTIQPEKEQLSCEGTTSDTISRQDAIDAVDAIGHIATMPDGDKCIRRSAVKYTLSMLPPIQPEPHEGHWIDKGWDGDWAWQTDGRGNCWRVIECSECGKRVLVESNYCPNCGAKMTISTK